MSLPDSVRVLERGWLSSNNIVLLDDEGATVVDTGYVTEGDATLRLLAAACEGRPLRRIVNTHLHSDHAGGNALLQAHHGCAIWIPPGDSAWVSSWDESQLSYQRTGQLCPRFRHDAVIEPGQTLRLGGLDWQVLPAAGHDHAMVMLWCASEGLLMSADALWQKGFGVLFPELAGLSAFDEQAATLDLIATLAPRLVIPGHGAPFADLTAALGAARSRLAWMREAPRRHADHALKVLVSFKLMEAGCMDRSALEALLMATLAAHAPLRALYPADPPELAHWVGEQLARSGVARLEGERLYLAR
jgi:glyoxylase-like metal-dependent hydrolase (beta-lactamase superfamily II)